MKKVIERHRSETTSTALHNPEKQRFENSQSKIKWQYSDRSKGNSQNAIEGQGQDSSIIVYANDKQSV